MYGPIKKVAKKNGYTENNAGPLNRNLKPVPEDKKDSLGKLPEQVRAKMGFMRMKDGSEAPGGPFPRFCGGKSKPFKRLTKEQKSTKEQKLTKEQKESGQAPQGAQAPQGGQPPQGARSTYGNKDKDLNPKLKF